MNLAPIPTFRRLGTLDTSPLIMIIGKCIMVLVREYERILEFLELKIYTCLIPLSKAVFSDPITSDRVQMYIR